MHLPCERARPVLLTDCLTDCRTPLCRASHHATEPARRKPVAAPSGAHHDGPMAEPVTPLPAAKAFGEDERSVLLGYLAYHRAVLARKAEGVGDEQARLAACPPSPLTLLGLIRHMTDVERWWFRRVHLAEDVPALFEDEAEWRPPADATMADALAAYWDEIGVIDRHLATAGMDDLSQGGPEPGRHTLRRAIVHMIEEYARHCGHADVLREAIDGAVGD